MDYSLLSSKPNKKGKKKKKKKKKKQKKKKRKKKKQATGIIWSRKRQGGIPFSPQPSLCLAFHGARSYYSLSHFYPLFIFFLCWQSSIPCISSLSFTYLFCFISFPCYFPLSFFNL
eukprot:TRINITY_DN3235_c0_g1_i8.p2 TRINITY_DN3235_c0_g1~~TRINITY_DN3235_c0_g1_i8.p2  ORF type:complete len:116 (+),score=11.16 TRINITY_DN3235_c0_g1_i8:206-553(+)